MSDEEAISQRENWHLTEQLEYRQGRGDPFAAAIRGTRMPMVITDPKLPDNPIVFANEAFQRSTGYAREQIVGRNCRFLQGPDTDPQAVQKIREAISSATPLNVDLLNYRADGSMFWNALYISPVTDDAGTVQFFFASQMDVTQRIDAQAEIADQKAMVDKLVALRTKELSDALQTKTILLHEVDHRVKNNLTMIGSLLRLQAHSLPDPALRATLNNMLERVDALAAVHRQLYQSTDLTKFEIGTFAETMVRDVVAASGRDNITVNANVETVNVTSGKASAVGLVINEVVTNAIKHAFSDGRAGTLSLNVCQEGEQVRVEIADDGKGFDVAHAKQQETLGQSLIDALARQVGSPPVWQSDATGTRFSMLV